MAVFGVKIKIRWSQREGVVVPEDPSLCESPWQASGSYKPEREPGQYLNQGHLAGGASSLLHWGKWLLLLKLPIPGVVRAAQ